MFEKPIIQALGRLCFACHSARHRPTPRILQPDTLSSRLCAPCTTAALFMTEKTLTEAVWSRFFKATPTPNLATASFELLDTAKKKTESPRTRSCFCQEFPYHGTSSFFFFQSTGQGQYHRTVGKSKFRDWQVLFAGTSMTFLYAADGQCVTHRVYRVPWYEKNNKWRNRHCCKRINKIGGREHGKQCHRS